MAGLKLGARGKIIGYTRFVEAVPNILQLFEQIENWATHIGSDNMEASAITTTRIANGAVTQAKVADGVGLTASGQYVGDGTVDRDIVVGFRPRHVRLFRLDTSMWFESIGDPINTYFAGRRDNTGAWTGSGVLDAEFQGISAAGFRLGHAAGGGLSNANTRNYSWFAEK